MQDCEPTTPQRLSCEPGMNVEFTVVNEPMSWDDAEANCAKDGGHLASIQDAEEQHMINKITKGRQDQIWIGLKENGSEDGGWSWSNDDPLSFVNWIQGEPNDDSKGKGTACATVRLGGREQWNDRHCVAKYPSICKKTVEKDSQEVERTYELSTGKKNWMEAEASCMSKNGHLVSIGDAAE